VVGVVTLTGVGFKLSYIVTSTAGSMAVAVGTVLPAFLLSRAGVRSASPAGFLPFVVPSSVIAVTSAHLALARSSRQLARRV
jgi:hypothetical protein